MNPMKLLARGLCTRGDELETAVSTTGSAPAKGTGVPAPTSYFHVRRHLKRRSFRRIDASAGTNLVFAQGRFGVRSMVAISHMILTYGAWTLPSSLTKHTLELRRSCLTMRP